MPRGGTEFPQAELRSQKTMNSGSDPEITVSRPLLFSALLLAVAHLPFVFIEFRRLWSREYYQFFPFAFVMFGYLLQSRALRWVFRWNHLNSVLLAFDLCLLVGGILLNSPYLVYIGALVLCLIACRSCFDSQYNTSLGYLILLLLIVLRPPLNYDAQVINWLQTVTTKVSSRLLDFIGYIHVREGNILEYPGKRFMVEEACSGVQSLFTVLFLSILIICLNRRRWLHAVLVLLSAAFFAGLMNIARICTIFVAWAESGYDLTTGWQHSALGYVALGVAAFLVWSADAFWGVIFAAIPDPRGTGVSQIFRNPLIRFWNKLLHSNARTGPPPDALVASRQPWHSIVMAALGLGCVGAIVSQLMML